MKSPRSVLQACLDDQQARLASGDEEQRQRAEEFLARNGDTVEKLAENGWRVACVPLSAFTDLGFQPEPPDETGHLNVLGTNEAFRLHTRRLNEASEVLTAEQCLRDE